MDILSTSVGVLIGLVTTSFFKSANADFATRLHYVYDLKE